MLTFRTVNIAAVIILGGIVIYDVYNAIHIVVYAGLVLSYFAVLSAGSFVMSLQFYLKSHVRGPRSSRRIAITFDDGPLPGKTEQILSVLNQHEVKAAFFCIGKRVHESPQLARKLTEGGHMVGNHSYSHQPTFGFLSGAAVYAELVSTDKAIEDATGMRPAFFRPPYGVTNPMIAAALERSGHATLGWSNRSFDTVLKGPDKLFKRVTTHLEDGDIILFHDHSDSTISILSKFIVHAREKGYEIVRVDELVNQPAYR